MAAVAIAPIPVPDFPNVPLAAGIPAMRRPTAAINAVLNGPQGLNAILADTAATQSIIGGLTNAGALFANVPGAQALLSLPPAAQILLYRVPGFSTLLKDAQAAQALFHTAQGLGSLLAQVLPVRRLITGPATDASKMPDQPWGIFRVDDKGNNAAVVICDAVLKFEFLKDWKISDYPVEQGKFETYNKVETPFEARLVLAKGGGLDTVNAFLSALQVAANSTELYNVSTPQWVYQGVNITHIDWSQEASRGAYLLQTAVWMQEIRQTASQGGEAPAVGGIGGAVGAAMAAAEATSTAGLQAAPQPPPPPTVTNPQQPSANDPATGGAVQAQQAARARLAAAATADARLAVAYQTVRGTNALKLLAALRRLDELRAGAAP